MGHRPRRVADQIRRELAELLMSQVKDPRLGFVTVTEVRVSSDLRHAKVWVSVLGEDAEDESESMQSLKRAGAFLRRALAQRMRLREAPELFFIADQTLANSARIEQLLHDNPPRLEQDSDDPPED